MLGEGETGAKTWVVKTHYPERPEKVEIKAQKVILLVRNPMDAIISLFHMNATTTHNHSISLKDLVMHKEIFERFYEKEIEIWNEFHRFWMNRDHEVPLYIVRYEDLLTSINLYFNVV